jgi:UDP-N-acetylglucosamine:LPS N-acetylglucosamine transferase
MTIIKSHSTFPINKKIDFLFVTYGGGHLKAVLPVAKQLINHGYSIYIFALTTAAESLKDSNLPFFSYKDLPEAFEQKNIDLGMKLAGELETTGNKKNVVSYEETVAYLGLNYIDLVKSFGILKAQKDWSREGRQIFYPINLMTKIIKKLNPSMVVSTNSPRSEKAAIDACFNLNIKSVCINDLFATQESAWLKNKNFANKLFVLNDKVKESLVNLGRPAEDIIVSGNPAFDSIYDEKHLINAKQIKKNMNLGINNINILYASTAEPRINVWTGDRGDVNLPEKIEKTLRSYVRANKKTNLIIRRHPSQNQNVIIEDRVFQSDQSQNIDDILNAVDIIVHSGSTVGLQGALIGKSVINIELSTFSADLPLTKMGFGTSLFSLSDFETVFNEEIKKKNSIKNKNFIRPNATSNIVKEITKLI